MADEMTVQNGGTMALVQGLAVVKSKYGDEAAFAAMASGTFLPRIQICQALSKLVTGRKAQSGDIVLVKGKDDIVKNFGDHLDCIVLNWRPKAMAFGDKTKAYFSPQNPQFREIEAACERKPRPKNFLCGPEYLIYVPDVQAVALFHFGIPSMRIRAADMRDAMGKATNVRSVFVELKDGSFYAPTITESSTPIEIPVELHETLNTQVNKFCNPPDEEEVVEAETVPAGTEDRAR